jgi:hypothetical protein
LIVAELAEPYQEDEKLRQRNQELEQRNQEYENVQSRVVTAIVIVENDGAGDDDQNAASSPFGRKGRRFWLGASLALLLVVGVILGVAILERDSPSIESSPAPTPTQSPAPTPTPNQSPTPTPTQSPAPTAAPTACTSLDCLRRKEILLLLLQNEVSAAEALQDESSPQFQALRWLATEDTAVLDLESTSPVILVERYVIAVLYFATNGEGWVNQCNFLSPASVCAWNNGYARDDIDFNGAKCNWDDLIVLLYISKSKHEEAIALISKFHIDSPISLPF